MLAVQAAALLIGRWLGVGQGDTEPADSVKA
jgi:hypothetical protein